MTHRSMIVMSGATRPEAQAAAVTSEVIRHGKIFVFHSEPFKARIEVDFAEARGKMTFRGCSTAVEVVARF